MHASKDHVCSWTENVNECYILHSCNLNQKFETFTLTVPLEIVYDSDEELLCASPDKQLSIFSAVSNMPSMN